MSVQEIENWAQAQIDRINAEKKRRLEAIEASSTTHGGDKIEQVPIEDEYPVKEGKSE